MCLAVPGKVESIDGNTAQVDVNGVRQQAQLDTIMEEVEVGDYLLVHTGYAIKRLSPQEAEETIDLIDEYIEANQEIRDDG